MKTKTEYKIVNDCYPITLSAMVNRFLREGWQLAGGVSVAFNGEFIIYVQAVTRTVPE